MGYSEITPSLNQIKKLKSPFSRQMARSSFLHLRGYNLAKLPRIEQMNISANVEGCVFQEGGLVLQRSLDQKIT